MGSCIWETFFYFICRLGVDIDNFSDLDSDEDDTSTSEESGPVAMTTSLNEGDQSNNTELKETPELSNNTQDSTENETYKSKNGDSSDINKCKDIDVSIPSDKDTILQGQQSGNCAEVSFILYTYRFILN